MDIEFKFNNSRVFFNLSILNIFLKKCPVPSHKETKYNVLLLLLL